MENAVLPKAHQAAQDCGACQTILASFQHDCLVQRMMVEPIAFTDKHAQQVAFFRYLHSHPWKTRATEYPAQTVNSPAIFEASTLTVASPISPSLKSVNVCRPKDEQVVKPPRKPTMIAVRRTSLMRKRSYMRWKRKPARKQPTTFTTKEPVGNVSPKRLPPMPDKPNRRSVPTKPANPIMRTRCIYISKSQ